jgi:hypothetical protein
VKEKPETRMQINQQTKALETEKEQPVIAN